MHRQSPCLGVQLAHESRGISPPHPEDQACRRQALLAATPPSRLPASAFKQTVHLKLLGFMERCFSQKCVALQELQTASAQNWHKCQCQPWSLPSNRFSQSMHFSGCATFIVKSSKLDCTDSSIALPGPMSPTLKGRGASSAATRKSVTLTA